jgi:hypothetical protein
VRAIDPQALPAEEKESPENHVQAFGHLGRLNGGPLRGSLIIMRWPN